MSLIPDGDQNLTLVVGDQATSGWTDIRITRGIERCPNDFSIGLTELFPGELDAVVVRPGDPCRLSIDGNLVITGYVDRYMPSMSAGQHSIHISGRGMCQDLVDCSQEWPNSQISGSSVLQIAQKLAEPFGISVSGLPGARIQQFNASLGEKVWQIIEKICRFSALLAYELPDGNLYLTNVGENFATGGLVEGQNIQSASAQYSMAERYSTYQAFRLSMDVFGDIGEGGNLIETVTDPGVSRHRKHCIIVESGDAGTTRSRAVWEMNRRAGRSQQVHVITDSWRDAAGKLWEPNTLVDLHVPTLKVPKGAWVISEVTFKRDEQGTTASLILMPPGAFQPEPIVLYPTFRDVVAPK